MFEPRQTERISRKPDVFPDITEARDNKRAAIECMAGREQLWDDRTTLTQNRGNHLRRNSGGQTGGRNARCAEGFQTVDPRTVNAL